MAVYRPKRPGRRWTLKQKLTMVLCGVFLLAGLFFGLLDARIRPVVETLALAELDNKVTGTVNSLCQQMLTDGTFTFEDLVSVTSAPDGDITGMTTAMDRVNTLRMTIGRGVSEVLDGRSRQKVRVPIGAALHWNLFTILGPEITVPILHTGQVGITFDSDFRSVGVGQTVLSIQMVVRTDVLLMVPGGISRQTLSCTVPLAENLFMGEIPQSYATIACGDSNAVLNESEGAMIWTSTKRSSPFGTR